MLDSITTIDFKKERPTDLEELEKMSIDDKISFVREKLINYMESEHVKSLYGVNAEKKIKESIEKISSVKYEILEKKILHEGYKSEGVYIPELNIIYLSDQTSIFTVMHELYHHLDFKDRSLYFVNDVENLKKLTQSLRLKNNLLNEIKFQIKYKKAQLEDIENMGEYTNNVETKKIEIEQNLNKLYKVEKKMEDMFTLKEIRARIIELRFAFFVILGIKLGDDIEKQDIEKLLEMKKYGGEENQYYDLFDYFYSINKEIEELSKKIKNENGIDNKIELQKQETELKTERESTIEILLELMNSEEKGKGIVGLGSINNIKNII